MKVFRYSTTMTLTIVSDFRSVAVIELTDLDLLQIYLIEKESSMEYDISSFLCRPEGRRKLAHNRSIDRCRFYFYVFILRRRFCIFHSSTHIHEHLWHSEILRLPFSSANKFLTEILHSVDLIMSLTDRRLLENNISSSSRCATEFDRSTSFLHAFSSTRR